MSLTFAAPSHLTPEPQRVGQSFMRHVEVTGDSSYPTGGETVDPAQLGFTTILSMILAPGGGYVPEYIPSTGKLMVRGGAASGVLLAEIPNATNLAAITFRGVIFGL